MREIDVDKIKINEYIDHTILKPDADTDSVRKICGEAKEYDFASVCVNPSNIELVARELRGSNVKPCCVVGFPLGATTPEVKAIETTRCIDLGAKEIDMVVNVGAVKSHDWDLVETDIAAVVNVSKGRALVKVIIETCLLSEEEKMKVCRLAKFVGADFVKTSTGFSSGGATKEDIALMRGIVGEEMGVKASGGVRSFEDAIIMIQHGATRLGTSSGVSIVRGLKGDSSY